MTIETRKYHVNGIDMSVLIAGTGPDVLLVHGYPDTHEVWRKQIPVLVNAGYRVIAPDTRGCGETGLSSKVSDYHVDNLVADLVALLDVLKIPKVRLVAHDWGAVISWQLAIAYPERVERYIALSTGHPNAYAQGGIAQKLKGYYVLALQLRGVIEFLVTRGNWFMFRAMTRYAEEFPKWQASLSRPRRLTAGMNYYRANLGMLFAKACAPVKVPVCGIWSSGDIFLTEGQMLVSQQYVQAPWRYARVEHANHWLQLSAPEKLNPLLLDFLQ